MIYLVRYGVSGPEIRPGDLKLLSWVFVLPVAAIFLGSCFRERFDLRLFDSPSRFLLAIPILWFVVRDKFNAAKYLQYLVPLSLIITLILQYTFHGRPHWSASRMSTYFADPLTFGQYALAFGLISLVSINLFGRDSFAVALLKVAGLMIGVYMSIKSDSRTGWAAAPLVIGFYILQRNKQIRMRHIFSAVALVLVLLAGAYFLSPTIHNRTGLALHELLAYNWVGIAPDTSTGMRITFLRMGAELFTLKPWAGFGDHGIQNYLNDPQLVLFASKFTRQFALDSGFHDELMTNAIRSGIWGVIATLAVFVVPFVIFCKAFKSNSPTRAANALLGLTFVICEAVSGLSTEVLNLKFTASFYALLIACLCGSSIIDHEQK